MPFAYRKEIQPGDLRRVTDPSSLGFRTTDELDCVKQLIGQERAVNAISFGLAAAKKGYNIFVAGSPGSGRTTYAMEEMKRLAASMPAPDDWVYVHNFDEPDEPIALNVPAGRGKELASAMEKFVKDMKSALSSAFEASEYEDTNAAFVKDFQDDVNALMDELSSSAKERGFSIKRTPQGIVNLPLVEESSEQTNESEGTSEGASAHREMLPDEFERLSDEERNDIQRRSEEIAQMTLDALRAMREREKELKDKLASYESEICANASTPLLDALRSSFGGRENVDAWIDRIAKEINDNFRMFLAQGEEAEMIDLSCFSVNVLVSNDPEHGAPVIRETNPTFTNIIGKVEYESRQGYLSTDFTRIKAGAVHKANGGFLLLEAEDLLRQFMSWDALKRTLNTGEVTIENLGDTMGYIPVASLKPKAVPVDVKVVIVGTQHLFYLLNIYDPEFQKIFKIKADFEEDMPRSKDIEHSIACIVASFVKDDGKMPFTADAVAEVIDIGSRLVDDQERITTQMSKIFEILTEATEWARIDSDSIVDRRHVLKAHGEKIIRVSLLEDEYIRHYKNGVINIETSGSVVGQINGLTVITLIDHTFGHPVRISANVFMGKSGVVNIEREVNMTGPIHNKGLLTLSSYLGRKYAQDMPISVSANISFEQTYSEIEGDSASSAELYCLLSALSEKPIRQDIAVTGSVDQFGNVQAIGGVNEKIEGFFKYCSINGLTGSQGVMIPSANARHLMLSHDVVAAVERGDFHVWAVSTIDEGIELLTGTPAGALDDSGRYPDGSIHGAAKECLHSWVLRAAKFKIEIDKTLEEESANEQNNKRRAKNKKAEKKKKQN